MTISKIRSAMIAFVAAAGLASAVPAVSQATAVQGGTTGTHQAGSTNMQVKMSSNGKKGSASESYCNDMGDLAQDSEDKAIDAYADGDTKGFQQWTSNAHQIVARARARGCVEV